jgi:regulator of protease activity HflC (stomatin/prohibitin superfamily)
MAAETIPALSAAARQRPLLAIGAGVSAVLALGASITGLLLSGSEITSLLGLIGGAAALNALGFGCTWLIVSGRAALAEAITLRERARSLPAAAATGMLNAAGSDPDLLVAAEARRLAITATWIQAGVALLCAAVAAVSLVLLRPAAGNNLAELALAVTAVVIGFPVLILERRLHAGDPQRLPEILALARLLRLLVWTLVIGGAAGICRALDVEQAILAQWALLLLLLLVAGELALRALVCPFLPISRAQEARGLADSTVAGLLLARGAGGSGFAAGLKERFGIDLAQSWAIRFLSRAALPLGATLAVIGWLLTCITTLAPGERAIYERNGAPAGVLAPGLHAHLPWPFGRVLRVEYGRVHELPLGLSEEFSLPQIAADADTPVEFDRLWERKHATDATYLVPGESTSGRSQIGFQLINSDVRVLWRVGMHDEAALAFAYQVAKPTELVRSESLRQLQQLVASRSLAGVLGEDRDRLAGSLQSQLQQRLDRAQAGIEITAVVIDAIHPPLLAVPAYHGVQAAEISAATDIARAKGSAASTIADAQREAAKRRADGASLAGEAVANAKAEVTRFDADRVAFETAPHAMRLERWLQATGRSLRQANLTIVDHRLPLDGGPTIDLRRAPGND